MPMLHLYPQCQYRAGTYVLIKHLLNEHKLVIIFQHYQVPCDLEGHMRVKDWGERYKIQ